MPIYSATYPSVLVNGDLYGHIHVFLSGMNHALKLLFHGTRDMSYEVNANFYDLHTNIEPV